MTTNSDLCGAGRCCAGHGTSDALCDCARRHVPRAQRYVSLAHAGNTYNIRNVSQREARIFFAQARNLAAPLHDVVQDGQTVFAHGREHVEVEPDAEADADATDASSGSDDPDASGDYELRA